MSAEKLREAAALMRSRAEAATGSPWQVGIEDAQSDMPPDYAIWMPEVGHDGALVEMEADAEHIASWHPAVALAVADLLTVAAVDWPENPEALAIATAYLGERP